MHPLCYRHLMSVLTVKNLDADVLEALAQRAAAEGRSVQDLARETLARAAAMPAVHEQLKTWRDDRTPMEWAEFVRFRDRRRRAR